MELPHSTRRAPSRPRTHARTHHTHTPRSLQFLLLGEDPGTPVKAIDFGLAAFFHPDRLPVTGLNPEGTPWCAARGGVGGRRAWQRVRPSACPAPRAAAAPQTHTHTRARPPPTPTPHTGSWRQRCAEQSGSPPVMCGQWASWPLTCSQVRWLASGVRVARVGGLRCPPQPCCAPPQIPPAPRALPPPPSPRAPPNHPRLARHLHLRGSHQPQDA